MNEHKLQLYLLYIETIMTSFLEWFGYFSLFSYSFERILYKILKTMHSRIRLTNVCVKGKYPHRGASLV
jgi:hypothetical protein